MKNRKLTVSIGIPAYNEQENIKYLLKNLLAQRQRIFKLEEIIVISDASTDKTNSLVKSINSPLIKLVKGKKRRGQQLCQNQILKGYRGDILVIIEADTLPYNLTTIENLVKPFVSNTPQGLGMVVGQMVSIRPSTFFEKIASHGLNLKKKLFSEWKQGNNLYIAGGHAMKALSRTFAKQLQWPQDVPEDAYTYFRLCQLNLKMVKQGESKVFIKNVSNLKDRIRHFRKYKSGKKALEKHFSLQTIEREYRLPLLLLFKHILIESVREPFWTLMYLIEIILIRLLTIRTPEFNPLYPSYLSTKKIITTEI